MTEGIGSILLGRLVTAAGSAEAACSADEGLLHSVEGIGTVKSSQIRRSMREAADLAEAEMTRCREMGVGLICRDDSNYPTMLKVIPDPPAVLYVRGTIEARDLNAVAIVGSRRCSHYGREQAERFGALLAQAGVTVVSGGARGVDSAAHRGAIAAAEGRTIVVLGCGVDVAYPPENEGLFKQVAARGAVMSEFALGTPPMKENFPRRNRIISGLSRGVLVVEADVASGALITARQAGDEHGRPVFALPGRVDNPMSAGPHALIRDGATLVTNLEEIFEGLGPLPHQATEVEVPEESTAPTRIAGVLTEQQNRILREISREPIALDLIIARTELPAEAILPELTMMSLRGWVKRVGGQNYVIGSVSA
ncbi:MAG: DNA-processing protein DprA [Tepidisphaeraceae bacterium]|jgi:DNA processing protein